MHQPENPARRTLLAQTVAGSAALALGSLLGGAPGVASATAETPRKAFDGGRIDVLIVGGGSAGAVLARRLSERGDRRVLLLEAGQAYPAWDYPRIIASSDSVGGDPSSDWGYQSQPGAIGHPIHAIRGKVLGGSSAINGAVAIRARREDFARWNLPGWSYDDLLPAFRRLETRQGGDPALHGGDGPLPVRQLSRADLSLMQRAFVDATLANGFKAIADFDGADANGVGPYPMNVVNGVRVNTGMAYLDNAVRARANLSIRGIAPQDHFDSGLALALRERWPSMVRDYRHAAHARAPEPGGIWVWAGVDEQGKTQCIVNLITQGMLHSGRSAKPGKASLEDVGHALRELARYVRSEGVSSLALPCVATGVGGLDWSEVKPLVVRHLGDLEIPVILYEVYRKGVAAEEKLA